MPKISVIIPTYNCAEYLPKAIDSILNQTYQDFEIIIVDDGSTDNTKTKAEHFIRKYPEKIRYFYQENRGLPGARNAGINVAKGDYVALLDADDELNPEALKKCLFFIENNNSKWCITDILRIENKKKEILHSNIPNNNLLLCVLDDCYYFIRRAFFFDKKALLDISLFDISYRVYEDWELYIRMIVNKKEPVYINEPLYIYRVRRNSLTKNNTNQSLFFYLKVLNKHHKRLADAGNMEIAKIYSKHMWSLAKRYFYELKDFKNTMYCMKESMKYDFNLNRLVHPLIFNLKKLVRQ